MMGLLTRFTLFSAALLLNNSIDAQRIPSEDDYYAIKTLPIPKEISLEAGGITTLPNGSLAVATRHGEVWIIDNPSMINGTPPVYKKFASGLHEILGLAYKDSALFATQRTELTKLRDVDGDGKADVYETFYRWNVSSNYHEYAYGPVLAPDGSMFVTLNLGFDDKDPLRGRSWVPWRGWTLKITPDGKMEPWATGMRSPCGTGWIDSSFFYVDNQGDWIGSGGLVQVERGDFTGHPAGLDWADRPESPVRLRKEAIFNLVDPQAIPAGKPIFDPKNKEAERGQRLYELAAKIPGVKTPAVWLPHGVLGTSNTDIFTDGTKGLFGPFAGQVFVGDMGQSRINRVFLERINGVYQGAAFEFRNNFESGVLRMTWGSKGELFVGQTNRGWGSAGKADYGLQSLKWTGKIPFEMKAVRAMPDGFTIDFTLPVNKSRAADVNAYGITRFLYKYHPAYGSPVVDEGNCPIRAIVISEDGLQVRLVVDSLRKKLIHELKLEGVVSADSGFKLLHNTAYYTLNEIPAGGKLELQTPVMHHHMPVADADKKMAVVPSAKRQTKMPAGWKAPDKVINLGTLPGLQFDKTSIRLKAGSKIKWVFTNKDDMAHNCVIVLPGTANMVGEQALHLGLKGGKMNYVPLNKNVLFHTRLITAHSSDVIYFVAPAKPGKYTFVCTYPGHYTIMQGTLEIY